jgi:hypothetical protein
MVTNVSDDIQSSIFRVRSSVFLVIMLVSTQHHNSEDHNINFYHCENSNLSLYSTGVGYLNFSTWFMKNVLFEQKKIKL